MWDEDRKHVLHSVLVLRLNASPYRTGQLYKNCSAEHRYGIPSASRTSLHRSVAPSRRAPRQKNQILPTSAKKSACCYTLGKKANHYRQFKEQGVDYLSVSEAAELWGISPRSVRNYCAQGRVAGAFVTGRTWNIPKDAQKPTRANARARAQSPLLTRLVEERTAGISGGIYHKVQVELTYNTNHIEGSTLSRDQTRLIFETSTVATGLEGVRLDDVIETTNHFRCVDHIIDHVQDPLTESLLKELHRVLKTATSDADLSWFAVGDYKLVPNEVAGRETTSPERVAGAVRELIHRYEDGAPKTIEDIVAFHVALERIHPFQDGNGRVGRLVMFKECLRHEVTPFIIADDMKLFYYRGLQRWDEERGWLMDTCLSAQDTFKGWLDYFRIAYRD